MQVLKSKPVQVPVKELIELTGLLRKSATGVETPIIWQGNVQRNFGVSLAKMIDMFLELGSAEVKTKIEEETMEIEDHQEDTEIEEAP